MPSSQAPPRPPLFDQDPGPGRRPPRRSWRPAATPEHRRRRRGAAAAVAGVVLLLVVLLSTSGGGRPAPSGPSARMVRIVPPSTIQAAQSAALARVVRRIMTYTPYVTRGQPLRREVALTFDDGPGPYTPQVLDVLRAHHVPATFFVVGQSLRDFGATLPRELAAGEVVGDHTENHRFLARLSPADQRAQLLEQAAAIGSGGAPFPHLFRPPYGSFDQTTLAELRSAGMLMVLWSTDTEDYRQPGVAQIVARALAGAVPGAIILMHDAGGQRTQTVAALGPIIEGLRRRGLRPVSVPQLLQDDPPPPGQPAPRPLSGNAG